MTARSTAPAEPPKGGPLPRIAAAIALSALFFVVLWLTVFDAVSAALAASGLGFVLIATSAVSDAAAAILEAVAEMLGAVLAAIGAIVASILGIFG